MLWDGETEARSCDRDKGHVRGVHPLRVGDIRVETPPQSEHIPPPLHPLPQFPHSRAGDSTGTVPCSAVNGSLFVTPCCRVPLPEPPSPSPSPPLSSRCLFFSRTIARIYGAGGSAYPALSPRWGTATPQPPLGAPDPRGSHRAPPAPKPHRALPGGAFRGPPGAWWLLCDKAARKGSFPACGDTVGQSWVALGAVALWGQVWMSLRWWGHGWVSQGL